MAYRHNIWYHRPTQQLDDSCVTITLSFRVSCLTFTDVSLAIKAIEKTNNCIADTVVMLSQEAAGTKRMVGGVTTFFHQSAHLIHMSTFPCGMIYEIIIVGRNKRIQVLGISSAV